MLKRKKDVFKFSGKGHSVRGMVSVITGSITIISFLALSIISSLSKGNGGLLLGIFGMLLFGISILGFILGIKGCREKEIYYTAPIAGMVLNGFLSILYRYYDIR